MIDQIDELENLICALEDGIGLETVGDIPAIEENCENAVIFWDLSGAFAESRSRAIKILGDWEYCDPLGRECVIDHLESNVGDLQLFALNLELEDEGLDTVMRFSDRCNAYRVKLERINKAMRLLSR